MREIDVWIGDRIRWLRPVWFVLRWPLMIAGYLGFAIAFPLILPAALAIIGSLFASQPPGLAYWGFLYMTMSVLAIISFVTLLLAIRRLTRRTIDLDYVLISMCLGLGVIFAIVMARIEGF